MAGMLGRGHRLALLAAAAALAAAAPARAQNNGPGGFFIEVPVGIGTPVGGPENTGLYDPSFWTGINLGYLFSLGGWAAAIGPAVDVQYSPGNVQHELHVGTGGEDNLSLDRLRIIAGARFVVGFGDAYLLTRLGVGLDWVHARWDPVIYPNYGSDSDAAAGLVAGLGMGYQITDLIGVTFLLDFPIGFHSSTIGPATVNWWPDEMVDILASVAIDFRL